MRLKNKTDSKNIDKTLQCCNLLQIVRNKKRFYINSYVKYICINYLY